ncbi:MAG: hypothetical protein KC656_10935 [Myxococcales bacterium]|nr:hypothetical protein [Myxococcales bacterium]
MLRRTPLAPPVVRTLEGWGGTAALGGQGIVTVYAPGIFEVTQLGAATLAGLGGLLVLTAAVVAPLPVLAWACVATAAFLSLVAAGIWIDALGSLRRARAVRIWLKRDLVETLHDRRPLHTAVLEVEAAQLGPGADFGRLTLAWPDGLRLPLLQGPLAEVDAFRVAIVGT